MVSQFDDSRKLSITKIQILGLVIAQLFCVAQHARNPGSYPQHPSTARNQVVGEYNPSARGTEARGYVYNLLGYMVSSWAAWTTRDYVHINKTSKALSYASYLWLTRDPSHLSGPHQYKPSTVSPTWVPGRGVAVSSSEVATSCAAALGAISCHCWSCSSGERGRINRRNIMRELQSQRNPQARKLP